MRKIAGISLILSLCLFYSVHVTAQKTTYFDDPEYSHNIGMELFDNEKYGAARKQFEKVIAMNLEPRSSLKAEAEYYQALCAYELFHSDAEYLFEQYLKKYPEYSKIDNAYFYAANLNYRNKSFRKALKLYNRINTLKLYDDEKAEYFFKKGYCHLKEGENYQAKKSFENILYTESLYQAPVNYYYAHIAYLDYDYETALLYFNKLTEDENFGKIVPYYIITIHYKQGEYIKVSDLAYQFEMDDADKRTDEIQRFISVSYYHLKNYDKAIEWFEKIRSNRKQTISRDLWYMAAFSYYMQNQLDAAIEAFQKTTTKNDSLAQNAYFHLADCYLKTDEKKFALNTFLTAYKMDFDPLIREESLFNYAKLVYELAYDPYNESIKALKQFINDFPDSKRKDEAYSYLVNLFLSTNNYSEALKTIELIEQKDNSLKPAYQRISHYNGIELFNNRKFEEAINSFKISLEYDYDDLITAANYYWLAECCFKQNNNQQALDYYQRFSSLSSSRKLDYYPLASYNEGYIYQEGKDYSKSTNKFLSFLQYNYPDPTFNYDAIVRIADNYLVQRSYDKAIDYYDQALQMGGKENDYALFQKAMALGGQGNFSDKERMLNSVLTNFPNSVYRDRTIYESGITNTLLNNDEEALVKFKTLIKEHPNSGFVKETLLKTGLIYYNRDSNDLAIQTLKKVIEKYPGTNESREALESLRNIYVDLNKVDEYFEYASQHSNIDITVSQQDSLTFISCENLYMENLCEDAIEAFSDYISRFPSGAFIVDAHGYKADCEYRLGMEDNMLQSYQFIINRNTSRFSETALVRTSLLKYENGNFEDALALFKDLEDIASDNNNLTLALAGQMRCNYFLGNDAETYVKANQLIELKLTDKQLETESHFYKAKSLMNTGNTLEAIASFKTVTGLNQGRMAAESQFYIAYLVFINEDYDEAEEETFKLVNTYPNFDYWVAKGFILLADIYLNKDNLFQARHTLQSIIDNYEGEDLVSIARNKLEKIIEMENETEIINDTIDDEY